MRANYSLVAMLVASAVTLTGCGSSDQVTVYPVKGTITLEGKAMPGGGTIAFIPLQKQKGKAPGGEIREDGSYEMTTYSTGDGSMAGEFRVVIVQAVTIEPQQAVPDGQPIPQGSMEPITVAEEDRIPLEYSDPVRSPLKVKVEAKKNELNFDLQRKLEPAEGSAPPGVASHRRFEFTVVLAQSEGSGTAPAYSGRR